MRSRERRCDDVPHMTLKDGPDLYFPQQSICHSLDYGKSKGEALDWINEALTRTLHPDRLPHASSGIVFGSGNLTLFGIFHKRAQAYPRLDARERARNWDSRSPAREGSGGLGRHEEGLDVTRSGRLTTQESK